MKEVVAERWSNPPGQTSFTHSPLPRDTARKHVVLVFRARLGMVTAAGGVCFDGRDETCPMCEKPKLGRNGATLSHLVNCLPEYTHPRLQLDVGLLWKNPSEAAVQLELATSTANATLIARDRRLAWRRDASRRGRNGKK